MNKGNIMRKLLRQPASNNENVDTNLSDSPQLRPSASQNTFYAAGAPIACVDRSPDGNHAVIAGTKVFKTVKVDGPTIVEDIDLRSIITSYATSHDISAASADRLSIKSVAWSHSDFDTTIFAACINGRVTAYDLNKLGEGLEVVRIHDHTRQVHKLAIHPFRGHLLLSASQDGTVKLFDARNRIQGNNGGLILRTFQNYKCNADAVRDVKWSPRDGFEFACSTEAGVIQKWDSRKVTAPILKFVAHTKACVSIAWHPDGEHVVSGGMDQRCHVWDFSKKAERNQKPKYSFDTPAAVSSVSWRPACWSATAQGRRAAQVSVSYDDTNSNKAQNASVHIWDLARPGLPFKEIEQWDSAPTGLLWSTRDLLWSVDRDGHFKQTDVAFVPKLIDRRSLSTFSFSASGDVLMVLEERQTSRRPPPTLSPSDVTATYEKISPNGQQLSVSRSDSEEDVVGSFLGSRQRKSHGRRSNQAMANATPTSTPSKMEGLVMSLDDAVRVTGPYIPQQVMAIGHAPSTARPGLYQYLTNRYLIRLANTRSLPFSEQTPDIVLSSTMEQFANTAENVGHYRLAQTWRILGYTMNLVLTRRAQYHRESRLAVPKAPLQQEETNGLKLRPDIDEETPRKLPLVKPPFDSSPINPAGRSIIAEEMESTSNVATPRVRPVRDSMVPETSEVRHPQLTGADDVENDVLDLPPPSHSTPDPINVPGADRSNEPKPSEEGYDFYGMDSFSPAINFHLPQKKQPLKLDYADHNGSPRRMPITRHDSGESFEMFSTSGDSHARFMSSSESDMAHSAGRGTGRSLRDAVASWENSFNSSLRHHRPSIDSEVAPHVTTSSGAATPNSSNGGARHALPLKRASPPALLLHQASLQAVDKFEDAKNNNTMRPSISDQTSDDPNLIESDYLPWPNDPEFVIAPIDPNALIQRTIQFEVQTGVLNASAIILSLSALLHPKALDSIQSAAILRQYHSRLQSLKLFSEAALLRNLCVPLYSTVWEDSQSNVNTGYFCTDCNKAIENDPLIPGSMWRCPRCRQTIDGCAVCRHREADTPYLDTAFDSEGKVGLQLWWYCLGCGHGGHTACMQAWHESPSSPSDGCCPLEGCLHSCLPGSWREQIETERRTLQEKALAKMIRESGPKGRSVGAQVRRDVREVNQSKAVEGVRVALALGGQGRQSSGPGGLERRRSVKVLAPGEER